MKLHPHPMSEQTAHPVSVQKLLDDAYRMLCEAELHLEACGFLMGTGKDGAFLARSAELRERMSGSVDLRLRRTIDAAYGRKGGTR